MCCICLLCRSRIASASWRGWCGGLQGEEQAGEEGGAYGGVHLPHCLGVAGGQQASHKQQAHKPALIGGTLEKLQALCQPCRCLARAWCRCRRSSAPGLRGGGGGSGGGSLLG